MVKQKLSIWYDEEGDYLEINLKKCKDSYFNEIKKDFMEILDKNSNEVIGFAIFNFKKHKAVELPLEKEIVVKK